jgi:hypothetical protein
MVERINFANPRPPQSKGNTPFRQVALDPGKVIKNIAHIGSDWMKKKSNMTRRLECIDDSPGSQ